MQLLASVRLTLARRPWIYWLAVVSVAGAVGLGAAGALGDVDKARLAWGEQRSIWVAAAAIEPGQPIVTDRRQVPAAMVPAAAVGSSPANAKAVQRIDAGEIITTGDVSAGGTAGLVPAGWVAFGVPSPAGRFSTGDHLRVYSGEVLVASGIVVDSGDDALMVAIPESAAPAMSSALLAGTVTIGLAAGP